MKEQQINYANSPVAWFVTLERARATDNFELAAKARQELELLGVIVKYKRPQQKGGRYGK